MTMSIQDFYNPSKISSDFGDGRNGGRSHRGTDFSHSTSPGKVSIPSLLDGVVVGILHPSSGHGFGNQVTIESNYGGSTIRFSYAHLQWETPLRVGQSVRQGQHVGYEGVSGSTTGNCVHIELWRNGFINPAPTIAAIRGGSSSAPASQDTKNRQMWLNQSRNAGLVVDGIQGPATDRAYEAYQIFLRDNYGYTGAIDKVWGTGTQTAHQRYYDAWHASSAPAPTPPPAPSTGNPFGIPDVRGLQKIAKKNGYTGAIDNIWGAGSAKGFAAFLRLGWGYQGNDEFGPVMWAATARWLRSVHGYVGNDVPGPVMRAALARANQANIDHLKI